MKNLKNILPTPKSALKRYSLSEVILRPGVYLIVGEDGEVTTDSRFVTYGQPSCGYQTMYVNDHAIETLHTALWDNDEFVCFDETLSIEIKSKA